MAAVPREIVLAARDGDVNLVRAWLDAAPRNVASAPAHREGARLFDQAVDCITNRTNQDANESPSKQRCSKKKNESRLHFVVAFFAVTEM